MLWLKKNDSGDYEKTAELTEHLAELRTRIIRAAVYAVVGMILVYIFENRLFSVLARPIIETLQQRHVATYGNGPGGFVINNFADAFFIKLQISTVGGLVLAAPLIVLELWGFIAPALTPGEKKGVHFVAPMSVVLFLLGVACAYLVLPMAVRWFLSYMADIPGVTLMQNPLTYVVFTVKMLLAFGLVFQLPVILMFLGKVGIITSKLMVQYWRQIAVGLFTVAMVVAPSNDPGTMLSLAIPLTLLFFGSIGLVKMVEPKPLVIENTAALTAGVSRKALAKTWDSPEEDTAWRDL
jgi:sec-independent protein translocase protein TatC